MKPITTIILILIGVLILVCVLASTQQAKSPSAPAPANVPHRLQPASGSKLVLCGTTQEAYQHFSKAKVANDSYGMGELITAGAIFNVDPGTSAQVIDSALFVRRVRILSGPHTGDACWTAAERVQ